MTNDQLIKAMDAVANIHKEKGVNVKGGGKYTKVSHRVEAFRRTFGLSMGIETKANFIGPGVCIKAEVKDSEGQIVGSGMAYADNLSKDKGLEKTETTAIGRALASIGLGGDEYATQDEIESWGDRYGGVGDPGNKRTGNKAIDQWLDEKFKGMNEYVRRDDATEEEFIKKVKLVKKHAMDSNCTQDQLEMIDQQEENCIKYLNAKG